ncbi:hypothetical protein CAUPRSCDRAFT_13104 [Caulochytrium protostelioides]|nr:hypothetical protein CAUPRSCDRAFT_13104 [Caulochytrium protostelioides]
MVLTGMLTGGVAYIFVRFANNSLIPDDPAYYVILVIVAFIVGISEFTLMSSVIESGVNTLFVGICEDPEVLRMAQPTLYSALQQAYPTVSFGPIAHHNNNNNGAY